MLVEEVPALRNDTSDPAEVLENAEALLAAATTLPRKLKVAANQIYPALSEADQAEWLQKQQTDQERYDRELAEYKAAIATHRKTTLQNKFVRGLNGKAGGSGMKPEYMLKADYLYGQATASSAKEGPLVEEMKAAGVL